MRFNLKVYVVFVSRPDLSRNSSNMSLMMSLSWKYSSLSVIVKNMSTTTDSIQFVESVFS